MSRSLLRPARRLPESAGSAELEWTTAAERSRWQERDLRGVLGPCRASATARNQATASASDSRPGAAEAQLGEAAAGVEVHAPARQAGRR